MNTNLIEIYKSVLATIKMSADAEGFISIKRSPKVSNPVVVKEKRWVLPTPEQLGNAADPLWEKRVAFHPLYENLSRGESEIVMEYRKNANYHLNAIAGLLAYQLLKLAVETPRHAALNPDQSDYLTLVKDADEKTLELFRNLMEKMDGDKCMINIFLRRGGMVNGKKHSRVGVVFFPLYEELAKADDKIHGLPLRKKKKDKETLMALLKYVFPKIDQPHAYDYGSDSMIAPTMDALMHSLYNVISPLNDIVAVFEDQLDNAENLHIAADWIEVFDNLSNMKSEIYSVPQLTGNEGSSARSEAVQAATAGSTIIGTQAPMAVGPNGLPVPVAPPGGSTMPVAPPPVVPVVPAGYAAPAQVIHQQFHPSHLPPPVQSGHQHSAASSTGRGLDFEQLMRANPLLSQGVMGHPGAAQQVIAPTGQAVRGNNGFSGGWGNQQQNGWGQQPQQGGWPAPAQQTGWGSGRI